MSDSDDDSLSYDEEEPEISAIAGGMQAMTASSSKHASSSDAEPLSQEMMGEHLGEDQLLVAWRARMGTNDEEIEIEDFDEKQESAMKFDEELSQSRRDNLRGNLQGTSEGKLRKKRKFLPTALQGMMGQANLCFARGEVELAKKLCLEIIRQAPLAPEPFIGLAQIYECTEDTKTFLEYSLIAAYLDPSDVDQWTRIAEILVEQRNPTDTRKAITCLTRAIHADPRNIDLRMKRIELLESIGEDKYAFRCQYALIPHVPTEQGDFLIQLAKKVAKKFHSEGNLGNSLTAMEGAYQKVPNLFTDEDLNLLLELMIENGAYRKVLTILVKHANVQATITEDYIENVIIPDELMLDFRAKLIVALIHLKCFHLLEMLTENVLKFIDIEDAGDCYVDISEALMKEEKFDVALKLLSLLIKSQNFSLAVVWLRHADCHRALGNVADAIESYKEVIKLTGHVDARLTVAALLKEQGYFDEGLRFLKQDPEVEQLDPGLLYERCLLLKEVGYIDDYLDEGSLLISRDCTRLRNRQEMQMVLISKQHGRVKEIKALREQKGEEVSDPLPEFVKSELEPSINKEWEFLLELVHTACEAKRFDVVQKVAFTTMSGKRFYKYSKEIEFLAFLGSFYNRDFDFSFYFVREYLFKDPMNLKAWNLLNQITHFADDFRYHRFLFRLIRRSQVPAMVQLMQGNYFLMAGTYKYAMNEYVSLYKTIQDPIMPFLIAVTLVQIASQKYSARKQSLVTQAIAYMEEYRKMREPEVMHEIHYNFGRMFHQFGLLSLALENYMKALDFDSELIRSNPDHLSLKQQIAYNIHLIYKHSGNMDMARKFLYEYIVV